MNTSIKVSGKTSDTGTLGKILDVLDVIADSQSPIRFTEVMNAVGQPRGTIHRHLSHLVEEGLIVVNQDGAYELGTRLLQLASISWRKNSFLQVAEPELIKLQQKSGENIHLAVLQGSHIVFIDKIECDQPVRMHSAVGNTSPIYCTGLGKAMLAALPDDEIEALIPEFDFHPHTKNTITSAHALWKEIRLIRAQNYAEDREEHQEGIRSVAAPIVRDDGHVVGGVSCAAPVYRIQPKCLDRWRSWVPETAQTIAKSCNSRLGPRYR